MDQQHDVLIVGSGPIGIAAARRLAEHGLRVTVLESGPAITTPPGSHLRNEARFQQELDSFFAGVGPYIHPATTDPESPLPGIGDSARMGDQGILWTNNCPRAADFERWDVLSPAQ